MTEVVGTPAEIAVADVKALMKVVVVACVRVTPTMFWTAVTVVALET